MVVAALLQSKGAPPNDMLSTHIKNHILEKETSLHYGPRLLYIEVHGVRILTGVEGDSNATEKMCAYFKPGFGETSISSCSFNCKSCIVSWGGGEGDRISWLRFRYELSIADVFVISVT